MKRISILAINLLFLLNVITAQLFTENASGLGINIPGNPALGGNQGYGVSFIDFDKDGFVDLTFGTTVGEEIQIYRNIGGNGFVLVDFGISNTSHHRQVLWVDIDNDNDFDLFLSNMNAPNKLYINDGTFNFTDISAISGIDQQNDDSFGTSFGDVDNDGFLDVYISNWINYPSDLYRNNGDNTFTKVTSSLGLLSNQSMNFCSAFFDYDQDGDVDLYKANDKNASNELFENIGISFLNAGVQTSTDIVIEAMCASVADINNNGLLDLYVTNNSITNHDFDRNVLLRNDYPNPFQSLHGSSGSDFGGNCWGASWADFDNDGFQDLYVCNAGATNNFQNALYINNQDETFALQSPSLMPGDTKRTYSCSVGDIDNDGNMDIVSTTCENSNYLVWQNLIVNSNNHIKVNLQGDVSNKDGVGSWIKVFAGTDIYTRYTHCGIGYLSQESQYNHIGIGSHTVIDSVKVRWSSGVVDKINNPPINQLLTVMEGVNQINFIPPGGNNSIPDITDPSLSVARNWMELLLESIRHDFARPTVHARNLFHSSVLMYDTWVAYQSISESYFLGKTVDGYTCDFNGIPSSSTVQSDREKALSFAMYRLLRHRFQNSPAQGFMFPQYDQYMLNLGYDINETSINYNLGDAAALGNYIATEMINFGLQDGSNELNLYGNNFYQPVNDSLVMDFPGNPNLSDFNRWQPLTLDVFIDQSGNQIPANTPEFLSPEWGAVSPFSLLPNDLTIYQRNGNTYEVYCDPGIPPYLDVNLGQNSFDYQWGFALVSIWSSHLDSSNNSDWDISPKSIGNISTYPTSPSGYANFYDLINGGDSSPGHAINPKTGVAYTEQKVLRADYARVLAEFWADGPDSETPPGHWFSILNYVNDHPSFNKRYKGVGPVLNDLEWDVKAYFSLAGALHDSAIAAWGIKGWYDYIRPVSAIRGMAELGQSSDAALPSYHPGGLPLIPGYIEVVSMGDPLAGSVNQHVSKIKLYAWKGPDYINNPSTDEAGVDWILAENWWPYQRPSFVTPPFAGYVSGHSTFSRSAAEVMTMLTGDAFFPDGMGQFSADKDDFLVFEEGPSKDVILQWATYRDASDQCSLSRIWGGIHPPADDIPGRLIGEKIGIQSFNLAEKYIDGSICVNGTIVEDRVPIPHSLYQGDRIISSGNVVTPDVKFEAADVIILHPGFESSIGAQFIAKIINCLH